MFVHLQKFVRWMLYLVFPTGNTCYETILSCGHLQAGLNIHERFLCVAISQAGVKWHTTDVCFCDHFQCVGPQVLLMFGPEYARSCGIDALEPLGIYLPGDPNYPVVPRGNKHVIVIWCKSCENDVLLIRDALEPLDIYLLGVPNYPVVPSWEYGRDCYVMYL